MATTRKGRTGLDTWSSKDWITVSASLIALSISIANAYYNLFRQVDDIRAVVLAGLGIGVDNADQTKFSIKGTPNVVFINGGNRAAAVLGVSAIFFQPSESNGVQSDGGCRPVGQSGVVSVDFQEKPVALKQSDVLPLTLSFGPKSQSDNKQVEILEGGEIKIPILRQATDKPFFELIICLRFRIASPNKSQGYAETYTYLGDTRLDRVGDMWIGRKLPPIHEPGEQFQLLSHQGVALWF